MNEAVIDFNDLSKEFLYAVSGIVELIPEPNDPPLPKRHREIDVFGAIYNKDSSLLLTVRLKFYSGRKWVFDKKMKGPQELFEEQIRDSFSDFSIRGMNLLKLPSDRGKIVDCLLAWECMDTEIRQEKNNVR